MLVRSDRDSELPHFRHAIREIASADSCTTTCAITTRTCTDAAATRDAVGHQIRPRPARGGRMLGLLRFLPSILLLLLLRASDERIHVMVLRGGKARLESRTSLLCRWEPTQHRHSPAKPAYGDGATVGTAFSLVESLFALVVGGPRSSIQRL